MFVEINNGDGELFLVLALCSDERWCATRKTDFVASTFLRRRSGIFVRENFKDLSGMKC